MILALAAAALALCGCAKHTHIVVESRRVEDYFCSFYEDGTVDITGYYGSAEELKLPSYVKKDVLAKKGIPYIQTEDMEEVMPELDILYMTRVQRERFFNEEDYLRLKDSYILTPKKLVNAREDLCIMHPLPRVNEISVAIDDDPRACYFKQVLNGKYMRMALIKMLLEV